MVKTGTGTLTLNNSTQAINGSAGTLGLTGATLVFSGSTQVLGGGVIVTGTGTGTIGGSGGKAITRTFPAAHRIVTSDGTHVTGTLAVKNGIAAKTNTGLWAGRDTGGADLVLRTGQTVNVGSTAKKIASFVALVPAAGSIGAAHGTDDAGHQRARHLRGSFDGGADA